MIPRTIPKKTFIGESVNEASFISSKGIDETKAPTQRDSVANLKNLEVNFDGSVSPRCPLMAYINLSQNYKYIDKTFSGDYICLKNTSSPYKICIIKKGTNDVLLEVDQNILNTDIKVINTASSTIVQNCNVNQELATFKIYITGEDTWKYERMIIDINTVSSDAVKKVNPNLMSSNPYSFRDDYNSYAVSALGILPYIKGTFDENNKEFTIDTTDPGDITVKELTESGNYRIIESLPKLEANFTFNAIYLKCFMNNVTKNSPAVTYYMRWEKTTNGVYWEPANNSFVNPGAGQDVPAGCALVEVPTYVIDETKSIDDPNVGTTVCLFKIFDVTNKENDLISTRADILKLTSEDALKYSYRCLLYMLVDENPEITSIEVTRDTSIIDIDGRSASQYTMYNNIKYYVPTFSSSRTTRTFSIKIYPDKDLNAETDVVFDITKFSCKYYANFDAYSVTLAEVSEPTTGWSISKNNDNSITITGTVPINKNLISYIMNDWTTKSCAVHYNNFISIYYNNNLVTTFRYNEILPIKDMSNIPTVESNPEIFLGDVTFVREDENAIIATYSGDIIKEMLSDNSNAYNKLRKVTSTRVYFGISKQFLTSLVYPTLEVSELIVESDGLVADVQIKYKNVTRNAQSENSMELSNTNLWTTICNMLRDTSPYDNGTYITINGMRHNLSNRQDFIQLILTDASEMDYSYGWFSEVNYSISKRLEVIIEDPHSIFQNTYLVVNPSWGPNVSGSLVAERFNYGYQSASLPITKNNILVWFYNANNKSLFIVDWNDLFSNVAISGDVDYVNDFSRDNWGHTAPSKYDNTYVPSSGIEAYPLNRPGDYGFLRNTTDKISVFYLDLGSNNANKGHKLYWNHRIVSYGDFNNNILFSDSDSLITPLLNTLTLNASQDTQITTIVPWRNYLITATKEAIYLIYEMEDGLGHKAVNTFIGIPEQDRRTCKAILNGIIFKSNNKVYTLQPGLYSNDDSVLNIAEISQPIESLLANIKIELEDNFRVDTNFAISTSNYYYLFIPGYPKSTTTCFKYDYVRRIWTTLEFPVIVADYIQTTEDELYLVTEDNSILHFEKDFTFFVKDIKDSDNDEIPDTDAIYGDYLQGVNSPPTPISFVLDSGQKTDNISTTKQYVETKLLAATMDNMDSFPLDVDIYIDGIQYKKIHTDINTDGAVLKKTTEDGLILGTNTTTNDIDLINTFRQLILRYSGKGKSIRHIISGSTLYNFKIYVTYYRYKLTHNKQ